MIRSRVQGVLQANLLRLGSHGTRWIGRYWGEAFPFYYVAEYQKSGGTWLGQLIADYLQLPFPRHSRLPMGCSCVMHNHWAYEPRLRRVFYLYRDGRDVMTSLYFHRMRKIQEAEAAGRHHPYRAIYRSIFGEGYDPEDSKRHMARFIEHELAHPRGTRQPWHLHVESWAFDRPHVVTVSYEELLKDAVSTLGRIIPQHSGKPFDPVQAQRTVDKYSFTRQTGGRSQGQEDRSSFRRKGVSGDWVNHFDRAAAQLFDQRCGGMLRRLGYVEDSSWCDLVAP